MISIDPIKMVDFILKTVQAIVGIIVIFLSIYGLAIKRRDVFKSELAKSQLKFVGDIRDRLNEIFIDIHQVKLFKGYCEIMEGGIERFKKDCPEQWEIYLRYHKNSIHLFYAFMMNDHYLIPDWIDNKKIKEHYEVMREFAPFTIYSVGKKASEVLDYQNAIVALINYLDKELKANA